MASPEEDTAALAHPTYWNERYSKSDGEQPTHEWFISLYDLEPFLTKHLFEFRSSQQEPRILHVGAEESVRIPTVRGIVRGGLPSTLIKLVWSGRILLITRWIQLHLIDSIEA